MEIKRTTPNGRKLHSSKESWEGNLQCLGNLLDIDEPNVPFTSLDPADVSPI